MRKSLVGEAILGVKSRQVRNISDELDKANGPFRWFRAKALDLMRRGKVAPGRETYGDQVADRFFIALAGGKDRMERIRTKHLGYPDVPGEELDFTGEWGDVEGVDDEDRAEMEVLDYIVFKRFHDKPTGRKGA